MPRFEAVLLSTSREIKQKGHTIFEKTQLSIAGDTSFGSWITQGSYNDVSTHFPTAAVPIWYTSQGQIAAVYT